MNLKKITLSFLLCLQFKTGLFASAFQNQQDSEGNTALMRAVMDFRHGVLSNLTTIETLLQNGADTNIADKRGRTPLMVAAIYSYTELLTKLIDSGADVNQQNLKGKTALIYAARHGVKESLKVLFTAPGINIELKDKEGDTALLKALIWKKFNCAAALYRNKANVNHENKYLQTSLSLAIQNKAPLPLILELLNLNADVNHRDHLRRSLIQIAFISGNNSIELARILVKSGFKFQSKDSKLISLPSLTYLGL